MVLPISSFCDGTPHGFPIIDSHLHPTVAAWMQGAGAHLERTVTGATLISTLGGAGVGRCIFVEVAQPPERLTAEQGWFLGLAHAMPAVAGIVIGELLTADPGRLRARLRTLVDSGMGVVRGCRMLIQDRPDAIEFMRSPALRSGLELLGEWKLRFDLCIRSYRPGQMEGVLELVRALPGTPFILDHCGKPQIDGSALEPGYAAWLAAIAKEPNVTVKISALTGEVVGPLWAAGPEKWKPAVFAHISAAVDAFGVERSMWGGDWPVSSSKLAYAENLRLYLEWAEASGLSVQEKARLFGETAIEAYGIEVFP